MSASPNDVRLNIGNITNTQQQYGGAYKTTSGPGSAAGASTYNGSTYNYANTESGMGAMKTPKGITRIVQWCISLIALACMAAGGSRLTGGFAYVLAADALAFIFVTIFLFAYCFRNKVDQFFPLMPMFEFAVDGILLVLVFVAAIVGASDCANYCGRGDLYTNNERGGIEAGVVFTW